MKTNINEMTHEEIIALTPEQLDWLVKYRCAENGVKNLPRPVQPEAFIPDFDYVVYEAGGFYFTCQDEAAQFCDFLNSSETIVKLDYDWQTGSHYKYSNPLADNDLYPISPRKCFSREKYATLKGKLQDVEKEKTEYKKQLEEWEKNEKEVACSRDEVMHVYDDHMRQECLLKQHIANFRYYKELSNGDAEIAEKFFRKAYSVNNDDLEKIKEAVTKENK
jgi:hypothetical protein